MISYAVIGLGFGDEGKGKVVSSICEKHKDKNCIVARYSGGPQASHKVVYDNTEHIFSNFGSGTLQNVPTYWTKYCTINPISFVDEYEDLILKNKQPLIYIHPKCPITTPYEIYANQYCKKTINDGTCGQGIGKTFQREEDWFSLLFEDLFFPSILKQKIENISKYYDFSLNDDIMESFLNACFFMVHDKRVKNYKEIEKIYDVIIYESSQGLLLDQHNGFFPHVTRSNIGLTNILKERDFIDAVYYVTRSYLTKHGNGNSLLMNHADFKNPHEQNKYNVFQGEFFTGILDLDLIKYAMMKNPHPHNAGKKYVVINCMDIKEDGVDKHQLRSDGQVRKVNNDAFNIEIKHAGNFDTVYKSDKYDEIINL